ncbi:MAG: tetratricopeptide repeat protein [Gemmatimonadota bacterium]|nr:tetratricopeptide repeat protein [Gemmatimonadota bacterium]
MSNAPKFRKKAVELEGLKQFDRAIASYVRAIEENENAGEEVDVALFNKVGDLTLRGGRVTEAVTYYERAVEHYVTSGLYDNAIALCNKILRNAPGRSNVYFTLGRICGRKGLRSDATRNFLEYATRMQHEGKVDEGMRALAEVADLMPELTEVGRLVEEHAARAGISLRRRTTPTRNASQGSAASSKSLFGMSKDLVFLDIDYDAPRGGTIEPAPAAVETLDPFVEAISEETLFADDGEPDAIFDDIAHDTPSSVVIEDLLIFDPSVELPETAAPWTPTPSVVDGASILKPYVDSAAPVPLLPELEPTEFTAEISTPAFVRRFPTLSTTVVGVDLENVAHAGGDDPARLSESDLK